MPPRTLVKGGGAGGKPLGRGRGWGPRISMVRGRPRERGQWSGGEGGEGREGVEVGDGVRPGSQSGSQSRSWPGPGSEERRGKERK